MPILQIGQRLQCRASLRDQTGVALIPQGNSPPPTPDAPPSWTSQDSSVVSVQPSPDGMQCVVTALREGSSIITLIAVVAGQSFTSTLQINVPYVPVLTSLGIDFRSVP